MNSVIKVKMISFLLCSFILYILFIFFPDYVPVKTLKYIGILLCYGSSFLFMNNDYPLDTWIVRLALFFTVIADFFLLVKGEQEVVGVFFFCIVQILYGIRLMLLNNHTKTSHAILLRLVLILIFQVVGVLLLKQYDLLTLITFFYFANLVTNVLLSFSGYKHNGIFAIGLFLFLCCDVFVGLYNSENHITLSSDSVWYRLLNAPIDIMWFFYFPSQVLITISILTSKRCERFKLRNNHEDG